MSQDNVWRYLKRQKKSKMTEEIAKALNINKSTTSTNLRKLEKQGLVRRKYIKFFNRIYWQNGVYRTIWEIKR